VIDGQALLSGRRRTSDADAFPAVDVTETSPHPSPEAAMNPTFHPQPHRTFTPDDPDAAGTSRRLQPTSTTRRLAAEILAAEPDLTRGELAAKIGISTRRLRTVVSSPEPS